MTHDPHGRNHRQPWLHDLSVCVDGNATAVSASHGDIEPATAHGLYVDDTRVLSALRLTLGGEAPSPVAGHARGAHAEFLASARNLGTPGPDPTVEVRRARTISEGCMAEAISVASRAATPVRTRVSVELAADGIEISAVKAGHLEGHRVAAQQQRDGALAFGLRSHDVTVRFEPRADEVELGDGGAVAHFDITVPPSGSALIRLSAHVARTSSSHFDPDPGAGSMPWSDASVVADDPRVGPLVAHSMDDLRHLLLRDPRSPEDVFAAAGTPWYLTLFGRDSLWAARFMLPFGTELAGGTLRALARRQGTRWDELSAEAPGKILHEVRRRPYVEPEGGLALPPTYYGTVDATCLWVVLLVDSWRWGLPVRQVRDLLPALEAALRWITGDGQPDGDGLLKYVDTTGTGLTNQGWKDSGDSMRWRDGRVAEGPIALVEAQAYAVEALAGAADLLDGLGEPGGLRWRARADELARLVTDRFWVDTDAGSHLALALDGAGQPIDGLGSNMGHVLGTGAVSPAQAAQVAATLTGEELLDQFGIRTLGTRNGGFNPIGYHTGSIWTHDTAVCALGLSREGLAEAAGRVARTLVASGEAFDYRWPELYTGLPLLGRPAPYPASCRPQAWSAASAGAIVSVALGLRPDAPGGALEVAPVRPLPFGAIRVQGLRLGNQPFTVEVTEGGEARVEGLGDEVAVRTR